MVYQKRLIELAVEELEFDSINQYMHIRSLLENRPKGWDVEFRKSFANYFKLRLSAERKDKYFELLYSFRIKEESIRLQYKTLLESLYNYPHGQGNRRLECSFVSKLVAIHDERWPIYDKHVSDYFGLVVPRTDLNHRIDVFLSHIMYLKETYENFIVEPDIKLSIEKLVEKHPILEKCHDSRKIDFLIWTIGRKGLWGK